MHVWPLPKQILNYHHLETYEGTKVLLELKFTQFEPEKHFC